MSDKMKVQIEVTAKDSASPVLNKAAKDAEKSFKQAEQAAQRSGAAQAEAADKAAKSTQSANKRIEQSYRNARKTAAEVSKAREVLGVRSENVIQSELMQTRAAYDRLKRSGVASQNELRRAAEATRNRVRELNKELGHTSFGDKARGMGRGLMSVGAGVAAGAMVIAPKMMETADYDMALARVADTGYSGGSIDEKKQGKEKIHKAIKSSITNYGGTKEDALSAINELMAQGKVSVDSALSLLPTIQKNATATGASSAELTNVVNSMLRFGVKESEIQTALDYMNASGKAGGFELKDMAQYFPQILAGAGSAGLGGLEDLKKVGVNLQQVYGVSGGASETATNLNNYYAKVKASSTADNLEKLEYKDPKTGKTKGIDMKKSMQHYMKQGQNASEALLSIIGDVLKHDKEYQALLKEYQNAQGEDKKAIMQKVSKYIEGTKVAEIMPDLQAGMATYAMRNDQETAKNVNEQYAIADKGNYNQESFNWISQQSGFSFQVAKNNAEMAQMENFQNVNDMAAEVAKGYSNFAQEFPNLNKALVGAKDAVEAFGMALATSSVMDMLGGGKMTFGKGGLSNPLQGKLSPSSLVKGVGIPLLATTLLTSPEDEVTQRGIVLHQKKREGTLTKSENEELAELERFEKYREAKSYESGLKRFFTSDTELQEYQQIVKEYEQQAYPKTTVTQEQQAENKNQSNFSQTDINAAPTLNQLPVQSESIEHFFTSYQADFQAFGQTLSSGIEAGLASQSHTIANQITVELDGAVVAEKVAEHQFNFNKRRA